MSSSIVLFKVCRTGSFSFVLLLELLLIILTYVGCVQGITELSNCNCEGVTCSKNISISECPSGHVIPRKDCSCCFVCAKHLTDPCNDKDLPCDADFGLICGTDNKCEAHTACVDDNGCSSDRFCLAGACAEPCKVMPDVCQDRGPLNGMCSVRNHRAFCTCPPGQILANNGSNQCIEQIMSTTMKSETYETNNTQGNGGPVYCHLENGRKIESGDKVYTDDCTKSCHCQGSINDHGELICDRISAYPVCKDDLILLSMISTPLSESCETLISKMDTFDGCCIPKSCENVTISQDLNKVSRESQLSASTSQRNNLDGHHMIEGGSGHEDDEDVLRSREMLLHQDEVTELPNESKIQISLITPNSASIHLPLNSSEAILSIASSETQNGISGDQWKHHMIPSGLPMLTLSDLLPNTSYVVKYKAGEQEYPLVQFLTRSTHHIPEDEVTRPNLEGQLPNQESSSASSKSVEEDDTTQDGVKSTEILTTIVPDLPIETPTPETIEITTENTSEIITTVSSSDMKLNQTGCWYNGTMLDIGNTLNTGDCDQKCECHRSGQMKCFERCSIPFFKKGTFTEDPLCFEQPSGIDECCVLVACARNHGSGTARELSIINPCDAVKCGPEATCRHEVSPSGMQSENPNPDTLCVCNDGYLGDAYDEVKGCIAVTTTSTLASSSAHPTLTTPKDKNLTEGCNSNNKTFEIGEVYLEGCSYKCRCEISGEFLCLPRCHYRHDEDAQIPDGCTIERDLSDPECCEILRCAGNKEPPSKSRIPSTPTDGCIYKNQSYAKEEKFYDDCIQQCMCFSNGDVTCQPRCPPTGPSAPIDKDCITLPDPVDSCCKVTVCGNQTMSDVLKEAVETERKRLAAVAAAAASDSADRARILHEDKNGEAKHDHPMSITISMILPINDSSILVSFQTPEDHFAHTEEDIIKIYFTTNKTNDLEKWDTQELKVKNLFVEGSDELHTVIGGLHAGKEYFVKAKFRDAMSNVGTTKTKSNASVNGDESGEGNDSGPTSGEATCTYKSKLFSVHEEFYDGCDEYCVCAESGEVHCVPIECPNDFALDLLDSHCVKWEPVQSMGDRVPPNCCPEMKCVQNSSCFYQGTTFPNFDEIPRKLTGCEKQCYCEYGNVTCQPACPAMTEKPPPNLPCPPEKAVRVTLPHDDCCQAWVCQGIQKQNTSGNKPSTAVSSLSPSPNVTHEITIDQNKINGVQNRNHSMVHPPLPPNLIHHGIIYDEEDQFIPPSTGNQPTVIPLDKLSVHQLQDFLHQLSFQNEASGNPIMSHHNQRPGIYVSVKRPQEIQDLERHGAKVVGNSEDGSVVLFLPATVNNDHHVAPPPPFPPSSTGHEPRPRPPPFGSHIPDSHHPGVPHDEITGVTIRPHNESTLHIDFMVSPVFVGLQGAVEVLYTNEFSKKPDPSQWEKQLFQQPEDLIDNSHLQLFLTGLKSNSEYHIQIQVIVANIHNSPTSDIFVIRTPPPALPPEIQINLELKVVETTSRTVEIAWRKFTDFESTLIDGVQLKYKAYGDQLFGTSELLHRSISSFKLNNLQPGRNYEIDLLLVPFTNQSTELKSEGPIHVETLPEVDDFSFTMGLETGKISEQTVELNWEGVPFPEDKFVNIYQVLYQSDNQKEQKSYFKVADRETTKKAMLTDLNPGTRYRIWLEAFLTNGKKKRSNVVYALTKVGNLPKSDAENNLLNDSRSQGVIQQATSYYGALVALAIVAAISIIGIIILLMILIKKQTQSKIPINDRKSESSYDNPSFKHYDIEANGHNKPNEL